MLFDTSSLFCLHDRADSHQYQVGIVGYVAASRSEVNDVARLRANLSKGVDMRHHVMMNLLLQRFGTLKVDIVYMGTELI